ncbi:GntR family transcriptional regulator [Streptomyces cacaoi]|uniref:GntR family transcriptional regulator n=1 Tax=Streptomyces cacaoi TaxID=1898 RepID=UPI0011F3B4D9|nr:GntR family transcriptional regulator [Streptomyces cacaoi]
MAPPRWRDLKDGYAERIRTGELLPGERLPEIRDLAAAEGVSKETAHKVYRELQADGLVTMSRGHGTVVRPQTPMKRLGIDRYDKAKWRDGDEVAFIADRVASGHAYQRSDQTQTVSLGSAPRVATEAYGLPADTELYQRARLVRDGGQPTHTLTSYYLPEIVKGTALVDPTPGPAGRGGGFRILYDLGYEIDHMEEDLWSRPATQEEAKTLEIPRNYWVVELHRTTYTADGTVVEFAIGVHVATFFRWTYRFPVPDSAAANERSEDA